MKIKIFCRCSLFPSWWGYGLNQHPCIFSTKRSVGIHQTLKGIHDTQQSLPRLRATNSWSISSFSYRLSVLCTCLYQTCLTLSYYVTNSCYCGAPALPPPHTPTYSQPCRYAVRPLFAPGQQLRRSPPTLPAEQLSLHSSWFCLPEVGSSTLI